MSMAGLEPDPENVKVINHLAPPKTVRGVRGFLAMCGYYQRFIGDFAKIARPLTLLTRKNACFEWSEEYQKTFDHLRFCLTQAPILAYPDVTKPYKLYTDDSLHAVGTILSQQGDDGEEKVIQYLSHQLTATQFRWCCLEREAFAVVYALSKLGHCLLGAQITVYTDHKPLKSLFTAEMRNPRVQRWAVALDEFGCNIQYRPGRTMKADFLSRIPPESAEAGGDSGPLDEEAGEHPVVDIQTTTEVEPLPQPEEPQPSVVGTPSMAVEVPTRPVEEESQLAAEVHIVEASTTFLCIWWKTWKNMLSNSKLTLNRPLGC